MNASTEIGESFLRAKRRPESVEIDPLITSDSMVFEDYNSWAASLAEIVLKTARLLRVQVHPGQSAFPLVLILEEFEDMSTILSTIKKLPGRAFFTRECLLKIPLSHEGILDAYVELFDLWTAKSGEKQLQVLSSASYMLNEWIIKSIE